MGRGKFGAGGFGAGAQREPGRRRTTVRRQRAVRRAAAHRVRQLPGDTGASGGIRSAAHAKHRAGPDTTGGATAGHPAGRDATAGRVVRGCRDRGVRRPAGWCPARRAKGVVRREVLCWNGSTGDSGAGYSRRPATVGHRHDRLEGLPDPARGVTPRAALPPHRRHRAQHPVGGGPGACARRTADRAHGPQTRRLVDDPRHGGAEPDLSPARHAAPAVCAGPWRARRTAEAECAQRRRDRPARPADAPVSGTGYAVMLGATRVLGYGGFVLSAGILSFLGLVWPQGRRHRQLVLLVWSAVLAAVATYLPDLVSRDLHRWRLAAILLAVLAIDASLVAQSDASDAAWPVVIVVAAMGHLTAVALWFGGLVAVAAVLLRDDRRHELQGILPSFVRIAPACAAALVVTGVPHALAVAGGIERLAGTTYGAALLAKVLLVGGMLLLADRTRRYLIGLPAGPHTLTRAVGAELALAAGVLVATAFQVWFAPH